MLTVKIPVYSKRTGRKIHTEAIQAKTLPILRKNALEYVELNGYGASDVGAEWPVTGHKTKKFMSYNGRLWEKNSQQRADEFLRG